jgi:REP element-mobilizing transposase RayT
MPDHVHLLVEGRAEDSDSRKFMRLAKQLSGYAYSQRYKTKLWQRYGYERVLREDDSTREVVRYILENAVRAGLTHTASEYLFFGAEERSREALIRWAFGNADG